MIILILILMLGLKAEMSLAFYILVVLDAMLMVIETALNIHNRMERKRLTKEIDKEFEKTMAKLKKNLEKFKEEKEQEKAIVTEKVQGETKDNK